MKKYLVSLVLASLVFLPLAQASSFRKAASNAGVEVVKSFSFKVAYTGAGTFTLPINGGGAGYAHSFDVDWGDGTAHSTITAYNDADRVHSYAGAGTYTVVLTGTCEWFAFNNTGDKTKITQLLAFSGDMGFKVLNFHGCTSLTTAVALGAKASLLNASDMFRDCTALTAIPDHLFDGCSAMIGNLGFHGTFRSCSKLTSIPADLFKYQTGLTTNAFYSTFMGCSKLVSIPADLFRYNTGITTNAFTYTFYGCNNVALTSIPADLFRYNTGITTNAFTYTFYLCTGLTSIPTDLFRYNTEITTGGFTSTFNGCTALATIGADLFRYNTKCLAFASTFQNCTKLQLNATIFYAVGESGTRFLNQSVSFFSLFSRTSFSGTQGTAPDLWNCNFGTGTPTKTNCFAGAGNSITSLDNYADIPVAWGHS